MAKISSYSQITTPTNSDLLLGTDVGNDNKTKNFSIADVGTALGLPLRATITLTSAQLLTLKSQFVTILPSVGIGKFISLESVYASLNAGLTNYDFTQDIGLAVGSSSVYAERSFTLVKELANSVPTVKRKLEPVYLIPAVSGGQALQEDGGIFIQGDPAGADPTQGSATLTITAYYRLFDANMIPLTS
tara:strand:+ start:10227 stop:10793 length:567 start_codon:yes stop_codon:yes gene_type:complete